MTSKKDETKKKKLHVKVKPLKLEGFYLNKLNDGRGGGKVKLKMKWRGPPNSSGFVSFRRNLTFRTNYSVEKPVNTDQPIEWDDVFESVCSFRVSSSKDNDNDNDNDNDKLFGSWDVSFHVLYSTSTDDAKSGANKFAVLGKASFDLANLASTMEFQVERKLPITLYLDGVVREANLLVCVCIAEARTYNDAAGVAQNLVESNKDGFFRMIRSLTSHRKKKKEKEGLLDQTTSSYESDQSIVESEVDLVQNEGVSAWKRRRLGFRQQTKNQCEAWSDTEFEDENRITSNWAVREIVSRDGQAKLKANVFFASFDQRSEKAAGESACTALVAVIAHWLLSNADSMPARNELDSLIRQGSSEWQRLCSNAAYMNSFPDKHFDLETVLEAEIRPLTVLPDKSFTGFFSPEKFESLKEAMSFDEIWNQISNITNNYDEPKIYIISWNDHFFVLKVDSDAYYIIDSLGERLYEGCNEAFILKFDDSSCLYGKVKKPSTESEAEPTGEPKDKDECEAIICRGKECCREFIKQFLAAIPVKELEEVEKKGTVSTFSLFQHLQMDFHYCSSLHNSSFSSSAESCTYTLFSDQECI